MNGSKNRFAILALIVFLSLPVGISDTETSENIANKLPCISSIDLSAGFDTYEMAASDVPLSPPGIMPVVQSRTSPTPQEHPVLPALVHPAAPPAPAGLPNSSPDAFGPPRPTARVPGLRSVVRFRPRPAEPGPTLHTHRTWPSI